MKNFLLVFVSASILVACQKKIDSAEITDGISETSIPNTVKIDKKSAKIEPKKNILDFIPKGFVVYKEDGMEDLTGDLNQDGLDDVVLLIKGTDRTKVINDEHRGRLDRNRRGIIVLFNKGDCYELASKNYSCFSSENEDGGVYYAPELGLDIRNGKLFIGYAHGRYGGWNYTFRYQNNDFELIGFEADSNRGPVPQYKVSINFLTKRRLTRDNLNKDDDGDNYEENFVDTWDKIENNKLIKLSEIEDFDELEF